MVCSTILAPYSRSTSLATSHALAVAVPVAMAGHELEDLCLRRPDVRWTWPAMAWTALSPAEVDRDGEPDLPADMEDYCIGHVRCGRFLASGQPVK